MTEERNSPGFTPGITPFDRYANWMKEFSFGKNAVIPGGIAAPDPGKQSGLTKTIKKRTIGNISQNVTALAEEYPEVDFYCFFTPYSAVWWRGQAQQGKIGRYVETERTAIEEMLKYPPIVRTPRVM